MPGARNIAAADLASANPDKAAHFRCLEKVANDARDGLVISDRSGKIVLFSRGACALFGYTPTEMIGTDISVLMTEPFRGNHDTYVRAYLKTGEGQILGIGPRHVPVRHKDGHIVPAELSVSEDTYGGERFFIALLREISGRPGADEALWKAYGALAEELNCLKSEYAQLRARYEELRHRNKS